MTATVTQVLAVTLNWQPPTTNADGSTPPTPLSGYQIYQGATVATLAPIATVAGTVTTYTTAALAPGTYFFALKSLAVNGTASAMSSPPVSARITPPATPGAPTHITIGATI
jgi:hypothetical protein